MDAEPAAKNDTTLTAALLVFMALVVIGLAVAFIFFSPLKLDLAKCDEAIKSQLKAPATYRRISAPNYYSTIYDITYDAENSFGVPLRSKGWCRLDDKHQQATWTESILPN